MPAAGRDVAVGISECACNQMFEAVTPLQLASGTKRILGVKLAYVVDLTEAVVSFRPGSGSMLATVRLSASLGGKALKSRCVRVDTDLQMRGCHELVARSPKLSLKLKVFSTAYILPLKLKDIRIPLPALLFAERVGRRGVELRGTAPWGSFRGGVLVVGMGLAVGPPAAPMASAVFQ